MNIHSTVARTTGDIVLPPAPAGRVAPEDKREAILAAALELFAVRGFHGTPVPLIAERARVGAGTVYRYFESKETIVNELYREKKRQLASALLADLPASAPTRQVFHEVWVRLGRFAEQHPEVLAFLELHHHDDYLDDASRKLEREALLPLKLFVEDAQAKQIFKPFAPEVLMAVVWGAFIGVVRACKMGLCPLEPAMEAAEACMWEAIRR
jgi:AcrR family transcriptional regulator